MPTTFVMKPFTRFACPLAVILALSSVKGQLAEEYHVWTNTAGKTVEATLVAVDAAARSVKIKTKDGREFDVPIASLSASDFEYAKTRYAAMKAEVAAAQATLGELAGRRPRFFRAPAGLRNPFLDPVLAALDLRLAAWTRRAYDTRNGNPAQVLARLAGSGRNALAAGDILLLHDGNAARGPDGRPVILAVLPALLARIHAAGLQPVTLADAIP